MGKYRYFAKYSVFERFNAWVKPEIPKLRDQGAYIEFDAKEGAPSIEGVRIAHAEQIEGKRGFFRLYPFYRDDYPDLYHHEKVCQQRTMEAMADICKLVYGEMQVPLQER